jgi:hypothetical protein
MIVIYKKMKKTAHVLRKKQLQIAAHCELYNEDVERFNQNFDFNLISSQVESMEGQDMPMEGGLSALDREAMAARMRLRKKVLTSCALATMPELPPLAAIKKKLSRIIEGNF